VPNRICALAEKSYGLFSHNYVSSLSVAMIALQYT